MQLGVNSPQRAVTGNSMPFPCQTAFLSVDPLVQTQEVGLENFLKNPAFSGVSARQATVCVRQSRFCSFEILQFQHGSTTGGEPGIQNRSVTKRISGREPGPEPDFAAC